MPLLGHLLQKSDPRVKVAALKIFLQFDKEGALHHLRAMAKATKPEIKRHALTLFQQVDFALAQPTLFEVFETESMHDLKAEAGGIIAAHPSEECLQVLYKGTHEEDGTLRPDWGDFWQSSLDAAVAFLGPKEAIENRCRSAARGPAQARPGTEESRRQQEAILADLSGQRSPSGGPATPAAAEASHADTAPAAGKKGKIKKNTWEDLVESLDPDFVQFLVKAVAVGMVILVFGTFLFMRRTPKTGPTEISPERPTQGQTGNIGGERDIKGTVMFVDPGGQGISVQDPGPPPARYYINLKGRTSRQFERGNPFRGKVTPVRRERNTIIAELIMTY